MGFNTGEGGQTYLAICSLNQNLVKCLINNFNLAGLFQFCRALCFKQSILQKFPKPFYIFRRAFYWDFFFTNCLISIPLSRHSFESCSKSRWRAEFWGIVLFGAKLGNFECPKIAGRFSLFLPLLFGGSHYDYIAIRRDDIFPFSHIVFNFLFKINLICLIIPLAVKLGGKFKFGVFFLPSFLSFHSAYSAGFCSKELMVSKTKTIAIFFVISRIFVSSSPEVRALQFVYSVFALASPSAFFASLCVAVVNNG